MTDKVKVAVYGIGNHAQRNTIPALKSSRLCELVGLGSRDSDKASKVAEAMGCRAYSDFVQILDDPAVQAVYIATSPDCHIPYSRKTIEHGKHVWCEKPLAVPGDEIKEVLALANSYDVGLFEGFMFTHHAQCRKVVELVESGQIGAVHSLTARFGFPHLDRSNYRYDAKRGGGGLLDAGCYPVRASLELLGVPEQVPGHTTFAPNGVDLSGSAFLSYGGGKSAAFLDWGFGRSYLNEICLWGETGTLRAERFFSKPPTLDTEITISRSNGEHEVVKVAAMNHFTAMFDEFARASTSAGRRAKLHRDVLAQWGVMETLFTSVGQPTGA